MSTSAISIPGPAMFLLGRPDGTFRQATDRIPPDVTFPGGKTYTASLLVDVDGDGHPDLVLGTDGFGSTPQSIVLMNDGSGDFTKRPRHVLPGAMPTSAVVLGIAALDVNRDGFQDLVLLAADYSQDLLRLLVNRGDGTFADETVQRMGAAAFSLAPAQFARVDVADINGDGRLDIYASGSLEPATMGGRSVDMMWIDNGNGTFAPVSSAARPGPQRSACRRRRWRRNAGLCRLQQPGRRKADLTGPSSTNSAYGTRRADHRRCDRRRRARQRFPSPAAGHRRIGDHRLCRNVHRGNARRCRHIRRHAVADHRPRPHQRQALPLFSDRHQCKRHQSALGWRQARLTANYQGLWWNAPGGS